MTMLVDANVSGLGMDAALKQKDGSVSPPATAKHELTDSETWSAGSEIGTWCGDAVADAAAGCTLFYTNAISTSSEEDLISIFEPFGTVCKVTMFRSSPDSATTKGCGLVSMSTKEEAATAIKALNGHYVMTGMKVPLSVQLMDAATACRGADKDAAGQGNGAGSGAHTAPNSGSLAHSGSSGETMATQGAAPGAQDPPGSQGPLPPGADPDALKLFVGNIPARFTEEMLQPFFETVGDVVELVIVRDRTRKSKGSAFLWYATAAQAEQAIAQFNEQLLLPELNNAGPDEPRGKPLVVRPAKASTKPVRLTAPASADQAAQLLGGRSSRGGGAASGYGPDSGGTLDQLPTFKSRSDRLRHLPRGQRSQQSLSGHSGMMHGMAAGRGQNADLLNRARAQALLEAEMALLNGGRPSPGSRPMSYGDTLLSSQDLMWGGADSVTAASMAPLRHRSHLLAHEPGMGPLSAPLPHQTYISTISSLGDIGGGLGGGLGSGADPMGAVGVGVGAGGAPQMWMDQQTQHHHQQKQQQQQQQQQQLYMHQQHQQQQQHYSRMPSSKVSVPGSQGSLDSTAGVAPGPGTPSSTSDPQHLGNVSIVQFALTAEQLPAILSLMADLQSATGAALNIAPGGDLGAFHLVVSGNQMQVASAAALVGEVHQTLGFNLRIAGTSNLQI